MPSTQRLKLFDQDFACTVCGTQEFQQETLEVTSGGFMAKLKERATVLICTKCGYVHWFLPKRGSYEPKGTES